MLQVEDIPIEVECPGCSSKGYMRNLDNTNSVSIFESNKELNILYPLNNLYLYRKSNN